MILIKLDRKYFSWQDVARFFFFWRRKEKWIRSSSFYEYISFYTLTSCVLNILQSCKFIQAKCNTQKETCFLWEESATTLRLIALEINIASPLFALSFPTGRIYQFAKTILPSDKKNKKTRYNEFTPLPQPAPDNKDILRHSPRDLRIIQQYAETESISSSSFCLKTTFQCW